MNKLIKPISFVFLLVVLLFSFSFVYKSETSAISCDDFCCDWDCGCGCPTIAPTPTPTSTCPPIPTPTVTSTPTPEVTLTPTPTSPPSNGGNGGDSDGGGTPTCDKTTPDAPYLESAVPSATDVFLKWQKVLENVTHYSIEYGPSSGNYLHSVLNTGDVDTYLIGGLSSGCFAVRAWNECAASDLSNEVCTGQVQGAVLGASTLGATGSTSEVILNTLFLLGLVSVGASVKKLLL